MVQKYVFFLFIIVVVDMVDRSVGSRGLGNSHFNFFRFSLGNVDLEYLGHLVEEGSGFWNSGGVDNVFYFIDILDSQVERVLLFDIEVSFTFDVDVEFDLTLIIIIITL